MVTRNNNGKGTVTLIISLMSGLVSLGGVAYAAGVLNTRVEGIIATVHADEERIGHFDNLPERLAVIETQLRYLYQAEQQRQQEDTTRLSRQR